MRYFIPDIRLVSDLPVQAHIQDKLGGMPWGLAASRWPKCSDCGGSQSLLAQFIHRTPILDLGREGRSLFVFQCNHRPGLCSNWEGGRGANACFVLEPEELLAGISETPKDRPSLERDLPIVGWAERDDGLTPSQASVFFEDSEWAALPEDVRDELSLRAEPRTRLGGVPHWIQSSSEAPGDGWRFIGQLDSVCHFLTAPKSTEQGIRAVKLDRKRPDLLTYCCDGPNFGDAGIGYIFLKDTGSLPQGWFFWQCG
jgi:hypothetical protein